MPSPSLLPNHGFAAGFLPVRRIPLPDWIDPADAFTALYAASPYSIWLDAGANATTGVSYLAGGHTGSRFVTASARTGTVTSSRPLDPADRPVTTPGTVFDFLRAEWSGPGPCGTAQAGPDQAADPAADPAAEAGFRLGWVGWFGYGLAVPADAPAPGATDDAAPDAALLLVDRAIAFDHSTRTVTLLVSACGEPGSDSGAEPGAESNAESNAEFRAGTAASTEAWALRTARILAARATRAPTRPEPVGPPLRADAPVEVHWRHDAHRYAGLILACQERIAAGDAYQLCLTNEVTVAGRFDPLDVYRRLRTGSPSHHGGLLRFGAHALLSASPEEFLSVSPAGRLRTRPIKGTRPRSADPAADLTLREELLASDKERAENLMIVDLMRNDLGRVAALGSVAVTALLQVESYPHVHQLVSTVEARLDPGLTAVDAIEACFPAGSMTGAPKASAMRILRELEGGVRGVYAGAFGYLGSDGAVDLAMVIRSIVIGPAGASIGTGGGITALSVPAEEIEETRVKARALIAAIRDSSASTAPADGRGLVT